MKNELTVRQQVWVEAWTKTAQSSSCTKVHIATKYADVCLEEFDKRFASTTQIKEK